MVGVIRETRTQVTLIALSSQRYPLPHFLLFHLCLKPFKTFFFALRLKYKFFSRSRSYAI